MRQCKIFFYTNKNVLGAISVALISPGIRWFALPPKTCILKKTWFRHTVGLPPKLCPLKKTWFGHTVVCITSRTPVHWRKLGSGIGWFVLPPELLSIEENLVMANSGLYYLRSSVHWRKLGSGIRWVYLRSSVHWRKLGSGIRWFVLPPKICPLKKTWFLKSCSYWIQMLSRPIEARHLDIHGHSFPSRSVACSSFPYQENIRVEK